MPGIEADHPLVDAGIDGEAQPLFEESRDIGRDVVVRRIHLHRPRLALHVHQAEVTPGVRDDARKLRIAAKRRDVVDELGAELERAPRDLGLRRVDRHRTAREPLEHGNDAAQLLVERNALRTGPRRLAADVDDRSPFIHHAPSRRGRGVGIEVDATVGKRIGSHIDDPHDGGPRTAPRSEPQEDAYTKRNSAGSRAQPGCSAKTKRSTLQ